MQIQRKLDAELFELDHGFVAALVEENGFFIHELATGDATKVPGVMSSIRGSRDRNARATFGWLRSLRDARLRVYGARRG